MPFDGRSLIGEPPSPWSIIAERKIEEWIKSGGADRLSNKGKPLDLSDNPFTPPELRMAYHVLKTAEAAPDWIVRGQDVEKQLTRCREEARSFAYEQRHDRLQLRTATAAQAAAIADRLALRERLFANAQRSRLEQANHLIGRFNSACPLPTLHRVKLDVEKEIAAAIDPAQRAA